MITTVRVAIDAPGSDGAYVFDADFTVDFCEEALEVLVLEVHIEAMRGQIVWHRVRRECWFSLAERFLLGHVQRDAAMLESLADRVRDRLAA